jgi:hypothetical protein
MLALGQGWHYDRGDIMTWLTLKDWDSKNYAKPHSEATLRRWAQNGNIYPPAEKHGREWMVRSDAVYKSTNNSCMRKLKQAQAMKSDIELPSSLDAEVLRILQDGTQAA